MRRPLVSTGLLPRCRTSPCSTSRPRGIGRLPRNVGIDHARGRYVFFCDHDDWLAPEALERMVAYADENGADVLVPKMVGHNRGVPVELFRSNWPSAMLWTVPLMSSLTPHKLFRREFLNAEGLRFPEGPRRLEDHVFVVDAYFRASTISVLSDYPSYHHIRREDDANAAYGQQDPVPYYRYLREVIDVIDSHTQPGPERDPILDRPFNGEILGRLTRRRSFGDQAGVPARRFQTRPARWSWNGSRMTSASTCH